MNTIKIYLSTSGSVEKLKKDFNLYQGSYQNKLLNVFVPTSILSPSFTSQSSAGVTLADSVASTSIKIGMTYTARDGSIKVSKNYYMRYLKTLTYQNIEYALYERMLPQEFTLYAGQGANAPTLIINVVNIMNEPILNANVVTGENLSNLTVNTSTWESQITTSGNYSFIYSSSNSSWQLDNNNISLSTYGISVDGTPNDGDLIVVNYTSAPIVLSVITSQTCSLDVMPSSNLDADEVIEPSEIDVIVAQINSLLEDIAKKQNITDYSLNTSSKIVPGAINEVLSTTQQQEQQISNNSQQIAQNTNDIDYIKENFAMAERFIGQLTGSSLPSQGQLTNFVVETASRQPENADVVIFILEIAGETDKNYKYIYSNVSGWNGYEIPPIETASNGSLGVIEGTYSIGSLNNTLVNISGGKILNIYVKDASGDYRDVQEYTNTLNSNIQSIVSGNTSVGIAVKALQDGVGNNIADTYLTQNAGATKLYVTNYALPRQFNDVSYISSSGYQENIPTEPDSGVQFSITSSQIGDTTLFQLQKTAGSQYQLANKNSYINTIYVSASVDCSVYFRMTTQAKKNGENWVDLSVELTDKINLTAGNITKVSFSSPFSYLSNVISLQEDDLIQQIFEVNTDTSSSITFDVYSNTTYPSTFYLNTQSQVLTISQGNLGEQPEITAQGSLSGNLLTFSILNGITLNNNTEAFFVLSYETNSIPNQDYQVEILYNDQPVSLLTPYNFDGGICTLKNLQQINSRFNSVQGLTLYFKGFIKIDNNDNIYIIVDEDKLENIDINSMSINNLNTQNITLQGTALLPTYISYEEQSLTEEQQLQARQNIGAGSSGFSGSYNDLSNIPTLTTNNSTSLQPVENEEILGNINLHKISKSGNFNDLNNIPQASTTQSGIIEIATDIEASEGTSEAVAVTPKQLKTAIDGIGTVFDLKGSVQTVDDLPSSGNTIGDVWYVVAENVGYIWLNDGTTDRWEQLGLPVDLSNYVEITSIVDNLTTQSTTQPLSANQGYVLNNDLTNEISARQQADNIITGSLIKNKFSTKVRNTSTWNTKTWNGLTSFEVRHIWTDGTNIYYSSGTDQYVLDVSTSTWKTKTWNGYTNIRGNNVWTDGTNIYYSSGSSGQYVLDIATSTWSTKTWNGYTDILLGAYVWTDGTNIYSSYNSTNQYVLNVSTSTWSKKTWNGLTSFSGNDVWTDGTNIYSSSGTDQYVLNVSTSTWSKKTWNGLTSFYSNSVWTDGTNIYSSSGTNQYVLDVSTSTWSKKTWNGLTRFSGNDVWTDGTNIYSSSGSSGQYVLSKLTTIPK